MSPPPVCGSAPGASDSRIRESTNSGESTKHVCKEAETDSHMSNLALSHVQYDKSIIVCTEWAIADTEDV